MKFQCRVRQTFYNNLESGKRAFNSLLSEAHMTVHKCQTTRSLHPCDFPSIFRPSRIGFITSHRSGRAVTFRCQSRAIDTIVSQPVQNGISAIFGEFPVKHQHFPTQRCTGQRVFMSASPSPQTTYYCHEENTKVNFVKLVDNPCGIQQMGLLARSHIPSDLYRLVFSLDAVNIQRYTDCLGLVAF